MLPAVEEILQAPGQTLREDLHHDHSGDSPRRTGVGGMMQLDSVDRHVWRWRWRGRFAGSGEEFASLDLTSLSLSVNFVGESERSGGVFSEPRDRAATLFRSNCIAEGPTNEPSRNTKSPSTVAAKPFSPGQAKGACHDQD
jgi:hypothetical protein